LLLLFLLPLQRIYVTLFPCNECAKLLIQAGINEVIFNEVGAPGQIHQQQQKWQEQEQQQTREQQRQQRQKHEEQEQQQKQKQQEH
jgi:deoxycytidylate deaminase